VSSAAISPLEYARNPHDPKALTGALEITLFNRDDQSRHIVEIAGNAYPGGGRRQILPPGGKATVVLETNRSSGWYDFRVRIADSMLFSKRYAGRVETGAWSFSDPIMGGIL
jgi:phospholipase C